MIMLAAGHGGIHLRQAPGLEILQQVAGAGRPPQMDPDARGAQLVQRVHANAAHHQRVDALALEGLQRHAHAVAVVLDDNGDGLPDLVSGNTNGELLYSRNNGTMADEAYGPWEPVVCGGAAFDLPGTQRSRPVFRDWNGDGVPDLLVGYGDGLVRLCLAPPAPPEPLLATVVSGVLRLTWPAGLPGDVVRVQRKELPGGEWILLGETAGSHWDEALPADGGALFRVTRVR